MELLLANCMKVIPTAAAEMKTDQMSIFPLMEKGKKKKKHHTEHYHSQTIPSRTQYMAANIGSGMEAKKAPNFPEIFYKVITKSSKIKSRVESNYEG